MPKKTSQSSPKPTAWPTTKLWLKLHHFIGTKWFFGIIIGLFLFQTVWIALSAIYPMLFDEEYHLGIIEIYSRQLSPFIVSQPPEAAFHGDITRYGSYLFHYFMSIPYWALSQVTSNIMTQVIVLRLICIALAAGGLFLWRIVLLRLNVSRAVSHGAIAVFVCLPIVPFALSQLNYDALAFLIVPLMVYLGLRAGEATNKQVVWLGLFLALAMIAGIVKFTLLPIALAVFLYIIVKTFKGNSIKRTLIRLGGQIKKLSKATIVILGLVLVVSFGFFAERYGVNVVTYRAIEPKCDKLHPVEDCAQYTVWRRDNKWKQQNDELSKPRNDPLTYTATYWVPHIFGDFSVVAAFVYDEDKPLEIRYLPTTMQASAGTPILRYGSWLIFAGATIAIIVTRKYLWNRYKKLIIMTGLIVGVYGVSLWVRNYTDYLHIGTPTAAQGRYFIPLLIPILTIAGLAYAKLLQRIRYKLIFIIIIILMLLQGGGVATYILYSNSAWYWPDNRKSITATNQVVKQVLRTFIVR